MEKKGVPPPSSRRERPTKTAVNRGKVTKGGAVSPAIIDIVSSDEGSESSDDDEAASVSLLLALFTKPLVKRQRSSGPKKKSTVWSFYVSDGEKGTTTCLACTYVVTPDGHTGNAVSHLRNNHKDVFLEFEETERVRKVTAEKHVRSTSAKTFFQPQIRSESSDPYLVGSRRYRTILRERALWCLQTTATPTL
ncbi:hypothetical protein RvY_04021 [Ramazzottius varieornatus]|uniref:BED-type domain-containing protein n=1 Tax=Ramazzottius varieornatus TaxID=947166 RepID=A0A1D1UVS2_RAMVA|nr:hypothetical protein RvY_04021 [Ramazzottius varieornatus]